MLTPKTALKSVKVAFAIESTERPGVMVPVGALQLSRAQLRRLEHCLTVGAQLANIALSIGPVPEPRRPSPKKARPPKPSSVSNDKDLASWSNFFGHELEPDEPMP